MKRILLLNCLAVAIIAQFLAPSVQGNNKDLDDPFVATYIVASRDTVPPPAERFGDFINDRSTNPFDLKDPSAVEQSIEYDPVTGQYIISEKIGDTYFRPPTYMTFDEYVEWRRKKEERDYFNQLSGVGGTENGLSALDPIAKFDVNSSLIDRLFGGTTVDIKPQGSIDLTFGVDHQRLENPILTERQRSLTNFDFDMDIQMNVTGKIGEKLNLTTNYNTNATFDFDNQIKLDYNSELFSEDDILKKIEAGNVSLPLRGSLIQGAQSLFGLKTELQFGHLRLTAIASQQKSQRENIQLQGGSQLQEFEVRSDEYDENRHFFLSHYNRDIFEKAISNLPQINTLFHLENLEVWITNDRNDVENVRDIVAFADLGEPSNFVNPDAIPRFQDPVYQEICDGEPLPDNGANGLYSRLVNRGETLRDIDKTVAILQSEFKLIQARDFEKVSARKLNPREFTYHPELGFVSVNINVQPDQVLAISFEYKYNGELFTVGESSVNRNNISTDTADQTPKVLYVKLLKSTTQRTDVPTWNLMMKNIYSIGAYQVSQEDFKLDVFYEDPGEGFKRFLPKSNLAGVPLIRVFNLDNLNVQGDPSRDGVFDFVPGVTINPANGRVMFPVLEPFGSSLEQQLNPEFVDSLVYQELYDSTLFQAREYPEKNRFIIKGSYKSSISSEISLGAFNIPPGSVSVTAGGALLLEGRDYEVDYSSGKVRILNDAILSSGVPINVSFEDNTLFGFQSKTMVGLRADYELSENFNFGATFLQLFERPFTQKVNVGDDPVNNKIYGMDINFSKEAPWLTKAVDKLPFYSTNQPSTINFSAEGAVLRPGHSRAINETRKDKDGLVYVDDFEGSSSGLDLRTPVNQWFLASIPQDDDANRNPFFPESAFKDTRSGVNRARLNWYLIDPSARGQGDDQNPYTSQVPQQEVFPNIQVPRDQAQIFRTFDLSYNPEERGPYNFDVPNGIPNVSDGVNLAGGTLKLRSPEKRWGGIMRALNTNDFQTANIEFLEFWMLSPFLDPEAPRLASPDVQEQQGTLYINLGNISEDILNDSRKFFENGLPSPGNPTRQIDDTAWGVVPVGQQITRAFDNDQGTRDVQDVGLDGLNNEGEKVKFGDYLNAIGTANPLVRQIVEEDPANDDFKYYNDASFGNDASLQERYQSFNNPQGNSQPNNQTNIRTSGTNLPDTEDINQDNTLNETESYFQYEIPLRADMTNPRELDRERTPFITDRIEDPISNRVWYRFRVPLRGSDKKAIGGIRDFRSIRFMRMYMREFQKPVVLRFARMELVRNQWRRVTRKDLLQPANQFGNCQADETNFEIDAVNIEENSRRTPFNYTLPDGIVREQSLGVFAALQNEQAQALRVDDLCDGGFVGIFKQIDMDLRVYDRLKMFVHAESKDQRTPDGGLRIFMRIGSDFQNNYYEYELPLVMSDPDKVAGLQSQDTPYKLEVWKKENEFNFPLEILRQLKEERNTLGIQKSEIYSKSIQAEGTNAIHEIRVKGSPSLGYAKVMVIGIRNPEDDGASYNTEVWINELRLAGLDERGGAAALARMDIQVADLGNLTFAGNVSSIGFGALDNQVHERNREQITGYDVAANLELGKFFPQKMGIRLPFYGQISNTTTTPEYDPYDTDIKLQDKLDRAENKTIRDSLREQSREVMNIRTYNFTNVRKERASNNPNSIPMPWDIENFSISYSNTKTERRDPLVEFEQQDDWTAALDYNFTLPSKPIEPFKNIKSKYLRLIKEFNFSPLPQSFTFSTVFDRQFSTTRYRFTGLDERFNTFFNKRFFWDRNYSLNWDFSKALKFNFDAAATAAIDEPDENFMLETLPADQIKKFRRDSIWNNIQQLGRPKLYNHKFSVNYTLPIRYLPFMDWTQVRASYQGEYQWEAASLNVDSLGNIISNRQTRSINADLNFEKLYTSIPYLRKIERAGQANSRGRGARQPAIPKDRNAKPAGDEKAKKDRDVSPVEVALIRPLLLLRKGRFTYSERFRTVVPGFMPDASLMGMASGFGAPGWDFIAGGQPSIRVLDQTQWQTSEDWLWQNKGNITDNVFLNRDVIQDYTLSWDGKVTLEPFRDFRVDLDMTRSYTEDYSETFKNLDKDAAPGEGFDHAIPRNAGQMNMTYSALSTLFENDEGVVALFKTFEENRVIISNRLGTGVHQDDNLAIQGYANGYGSLQQEVMIPAFMAAYTGKDARTVDLNVFNLRPQLNWRLTYNGLAKIPFFQEIFSNFSLTHAYKGNLTVSRYQTSNYFLRNLDPTTGTSLDTVDYNFYPRIEIPDVVIQEGFSPLIAIEATLQNGMSFNIDYNRTRNLALNSTSKLLSESRSTEIIIGFGYLMKGVDIPFLTGSKKKGATRPGPDGSGGNAPTPSRGGGGRGGQLDAQDLDIQFNLSMRNDLTLAQQLDGPGAEPTRGNYSLTLSPTVEYKLSRRLSLQAFFDYRRVVPKTSAGFPRTDSAGGIRVRFQLN
ncbi:MAG: cell surface protein SprA [Saprospiraceae bacterium]